jgi:hypothetical protein
MSFECQHCERDYPIALDSEPNGLARLRPYPSCSADHLARCIESMARCIVGDLNHFVSQSSPEAQWMADMQFIADSIRQLGKGAS